MQAKTRPDSMPHRIKPNRIGMTQVHQRWCPHCQLKTMQVGDLPWGWPAHGGRAPRPEAVVPWAPGHCLQCIADGADCCSIRPFTRYTSEDPCEPWADRCDRAQDREDQQIPR